jgi:steroid 5-alpha reductase family enzyme
MSNLIRGCLTNGIGLAILLPLSVYLELQLFAYIALGIQYFVYLVHGLPFNSEKYYDCSGSLTHLALFLTSMMTSETITRRQIVNTFFGVIWLTRLGSFLFTRILSDKLDTRFTEIKTSGIRFLGVWTL